MNLAETYNYLPWAAFLGIVSVLLLLDLGVFHRKSHQIHWKEALAWTVVWVTLSLSFNAYILFTRGPERALEFLTGYLIEQALSVDNIFVFVVILSYFRVPKEYQHRVLYYGVLGAIIMRGVFIGLGAELLTHFHWIMYVFGALLVFTGLKLFKQEELDVEPEQNFILRIARSTLPSTPQFHGEKFFIRENGKLLATPLLFVLISVEITDLIFAVDSIPAIFGVTQDPFIVFTSNICAVLGLRSLYFLLAGVMEKLHYLRVGLALILIFIGSKMLLADIFKIPITWSLFAVAGILFLSIVASLMLPNNGDNTDESA